jgi:hypothetical protein
MILIMFLRVRRTPPGAEPSHAVGFSVLPRWEHAILPAVRIIARRALRELWERVLFHFAADLTITPLAGRN